MMAGRAGGEGRQGPREAEPEARPMGPTTQEAEPEARPGMCVLDSLEYAGRPVHRSAHRTRLDGAPTGSTRGRPDLWTRTSSLRSLVYG